MVKSTLATVQKSVAVVNHPTIVWERRTLTLTRDNKVHCQIHRLTRPSKSFPKGRLTTTPTFVAGAIPRGMSVDVFLNIYTVGGYTKV